MLGKAFLLPMIAVKTFGACSQRAISCPALLQSFIAVLSKLKL
jgi:hypothetical protein